MKLLAPALFMPFLFGFSAAQAKTFALRGGTVHTVSGGVLESATLLFDETGILEIGKQADVEGDATIIECTGRHIYPGLIAASSQIGLVEIRAVRSTVDTGEGGYVQPERIGSQGI